MLRCTFFMRKKTLTYKTTNRRKNKKKNKTKRKYTRKSNRKVKRGGTTYNDNLNKNKNKVSGLDQSYNLKTHVRESHNCYTYYLNKKSGEVIKLCERDLPKYNMCRR